MSKSCIDLSLFKAFLEPLDKEALDAVYKAVNHRRNHLLLEKRRHRRDKRQRNEANKGAVPQGKRLAVFLAEDWQCYFLEFEDTDRKYSVYSHGDPATLTMKVDGLDSRMFVKPLYIGMGSCDRPYNFTRSVMHSKALNDLMGRGYKKEDLVCVLRSNLTEREARILEAKLILYWGVSTYQGKSPERQKYFGRSVRCLLNSRYEKIPDHYSDLI